LYTRPTADYDNVNNNNNNMRCKNKNVSPLDTIVSGQNRLVPPPPHRPGQRCSQTWQTSRRRPRLPRSTPSRVCARPMVVRDPPPVAQGIRICRSLHLVARSPLAHRPTPVLLLWAPCVYNIPHPQSYQTVNFNKNRDIVMADLLVDMDYAIMTINSQIVYKPTSQRDDPEPDNDREVYVGNLPQHYTIEKFVNFAK